MLLFKTCSWPLLSTHSSSFFRFWIMRMPLYLTIYTMAYVLTMFPVILTMCQKLCTWCSSLLITWPTFHKIWPQCVRQTIIPYNTFSAKWTYPPSLYHFSLAAPSLFGMTIGFPFFMDLFPVLRDRGNFGMNKSKNVLLVNWRLLVPHNSVGEQITSTKVVRFITQSGRTTRIQNLNNISYLLQLKVPLPSDWFTEGKNPLGWTCESNMQLSWSNLLTARFKIMLMSATNNARDNVYSTSLTLQ